MSKQHLHRRVVAAAFLAGVFAAASVASAERPPPFSGTTSTQSPDLEEPVEGKIELGEDSLRFEVEREGLLTALIAGPHIDGVVMLIPEQQLALEMPNPPDGTPEIEAVDPNNPCEGREDMSCKRLRQEALSGRSTQVWEVGQGDEVSTVWIDEELRFPLKIEEPDGQVFEISEIRLGAPPKDRFQIPAGYERMQMPVEPHGEEDFGEDSEGLESPGDGSGSPDKSPASPGQPGPSSEEL